MAKFPEVSDDNIKLFNEVKESIDFYQWVEFILLSNSKQKELYKVAKANDLLESVVSILSKEDDINCTIIINEEIFDGLPEEQQRLAFEECLTGVLVNNESNVVTVEKPNFNTHTGMLQKYGHDPIIVLHESIKSLFDAKKEREDQEKAAKTSKKKKSF